MVSEEYIEDKDENEYEELKSGNNCSNLIKYAEWVFFQYPCVPLEFDLAQSIQNIMKDSAETDWTNWQFNYKQGISLANEPADFLLEICDPILWKRDDFEEASFGLINTFKYNMKMGKVFIQELKNTDILLLKKNFIYFLNILLGEIKIDRHCFDNPKNFFDAKLKTLGIYLEGDRANQNFNTHANNKNQDKAPIRLNGILKSDKSKHDSQKKTVQFSTDFWTIAKPKILHSTNEQGEILGLRCEVSFKP